MLNFRYPILGLLILTIVDFMVVAGCGSRDPIERIAKREEANDFFGNGMSRLLDLPATASADEVIGKLFVPPMKIITNRNVRIADNLYKAAIVETTDGRKVVLIRFDEEVNQRSKSKGWWTRVYDD